MLKLLFLLLVSSTLVHFAFFFHILLLCICKISLTNLEYLKPTILFYVLVFYLRPTSLFSLPAHQVGCKNIEPYSCLFSFGSAWVKHLLSILCMMSISRQEFCQCDDPKVAKAFGVSLKITRSNLTRLKILQAFPSTTLKALSFTSYAWVIS